MDKLIKHPQEHDRLMRFYQPLLSQWRAKLFLQPHWQIELRIVCPDDMPDAIGRCSWGYLPNATFVICLACDLDGPECERTLAHELVEAWLGRYGDFVEQLIVKQKGKAHRDYLHEQHGDIRDEFIEQLLCVLIGHERPARVR